jgi:phosphoribosylglycinamide formyltransferase-1
MIKVVILASGSGSNAENLVRYFRNNDSVRIESIGTNNPQAGVIARAEKLGVRSFVFSSEDFKEDKGMPDKLKEHGADYLVLAGFLLLVPKRIIEAFPGRIINIHPALLPAFGGRGYYGSRVHQSVIDSGAIMSGITIHQVNEKYDAGEIIFQAACHVDKTETASTLAEKIHRLEHAYYPVVLEKLLSGLK